MRSHLDALRPVLGIVFLAGYAWQTFAPGSFGTDLFLGVGAVLFVISVPWSSAFHRAFALVAFVAFCAVIFTGQFDIADFLGGMPAYFAIVAVLLVLSIAGYPIQAARYEVQIRALMAALTRRGVSIKATAGVLGHVLGAVLDVGAFVLIDVISGRSAPKERLEALKWAGRTFSFAPLWTNLNVLTATTIVLTGVSYPMLLAVTLPFVLIGLGGTLLFAQKAGGEVEEIPQAPLDRGAAAYGGHRCDGRDYRTLYRRACGGAHPRSVASGTARARGAQLAHGIALRVRPFRSCWHPRTLSESSWRPRPARRIALCPSDGPGRPCARAHHGRWIRRRHTCHTDGAVAQHRLPAGRRTGSGAVGGGAPARRPVHDPAHPVFQRRDHALAADRAAPAGDRTQAQLGFRPHRCCRGT